MATAKLLLKTSQTLSDGSHPITIQILKDRKKSTLSLSFSCLVRDWDVKTNLPKNNRLSLICNKELIKVQELLFEAELKNWTSRKIAQVHKQKDQREISFFEYCDKLSKESESGFGTITTTNTKINKFKLFLNRDIYFDEITHELLKEYKTHLKDLKSINRYLSAVRQIYNHAVEYDVYTPRKGNPFKSDLFSKKIETTQRNLSIKETKTLFNYEIILTRWQRQEIKELTLDIWKFCFLMRGMNFVDAVLIDPKNIGEHYQFTRQKLKSRTNNKLKVKIFPEARDIVDKYYDSKNRYLFPLLENSENIETTAKAYKKYDYKKHIITENMKRLGKELGFKIPLTTMSPRYTFINIAKEIGVPFLFLQELIGHKTMSTTDIYMDAFPQEQLDEYHRKVIDEILKANNSRIIRE